MKKHLIIVHPLDVRNYTRQVIQAMEDFSRQYFKLHDEFYIRSRIHYNQAKKEGPNTYTSWGGVEWKHNQGYEAFVVIKVQEVLEEGNQFIEYEEYGNDLIVGDILECKWRTYISATCAHEVAHTVHQWNAYHSESKEYVNEILKDPHGKTFQEIYAVLRKKFVNKRRIRYDVC